MLDDRPPIFYQLTPATLADGQQAHGFRCDSRGALMVSSTNAGVSTVALADNADGTAASATVNGADADTTALTAADVESLNITYA